MRFEFEISNAFEAFSKVETSNSNIICSIITDKELLGEDPTIPADMENSPCVRYIKRAMSCKVSNIGDKIEDWIKPYYAIAQPLVSLFRENFQRLIPNVFSVNAKLQDSDGVNNLWDLDLYKTMVSFNPVKNNDRFIFINNNASEVNNGYYCLDVIYNNSDVSCRLSKSGNQGGSPVQVDDSQDLRDLVGLKLTEEKGQKQFLANFLLFKEFISNIFNCINECDSEYTGDLKDLKYVNTDIGAVRKSVYDRENNNSSADVKYDQDNIVEYDMHDYIYDVDDFDYNDNLTDTKIEYDMLTSIGDVEAFKFVERRGKNEIRKTVIGEDGLPYESVEYVDALIPDIFIIYNNRNLTAVLGDANNQLETDIDLSEFEIIDPQCFALKYHSLISNTNDKLFLNCSKSKETDCKVYYTYLSKLTSAFFDIFSICLQLTFIENRSPVAVINVSNYFDMNELGTDLELARVLPYFCDFLRKYAKKDAVVLFIGVKEGSFTHKALLRYKEKNCK